MTEYKNDHLTINVETAPGCLVTLTAKLSAEATDAAYLKAVKEISKQVAIPGFRKGKAPVSRIISEFSSHIEKQWREDLLNDVFHEAIALSSLRPTSQAGLKSANLVSHSRTGGAEMRYEYETGPNIPHIDLSNIQLKPVQKMEVTPDMIEDAQERLRLHHATWTGVEDRALIEGDYAELSIQDAETGNLLFNEIDIHVVPGEMGDWMRKLIVGMRPGDVKEGMSENELPFSQKEKKEKSEENSFKPTMCRITLHKIWHVDKPPLDDELAKKAGVENVEILKERIVQSLEAETNASVKQKQWDQLAEILSETFSFDLPSSMLKDELMAITKNQAQTQPNLTEEKRKELFATTQHNLIRDMRMAFLIRHYFTQEKLSITQGDLMREQLEQLYMTPPAQRVISDDMNEEERNERFIWLAMRKKVREHMLEKVATPA